MPNEDGKHMNNCGGTVVVGGSAWQEIVAYVSPVDGFVIEIEMESSTSFLRVVQGIKVVQTKKSTVRRHDYSLHF